MDEAMAPPLKRRKLSSSLSEPKFILDNSTAPAELIPSSSRGINSLPQTYSSLAPSRTASNQNEDQEQKIPKPAYGGIADFKVLVPRQGTGSSSSVVSTSGENAMTVLTSAITSMTSSISVSLSTSASSPTLPADTVPAGVTQSESSRSSSDRPSSSPSSYGSSTVSSSSVNDTSTITSSATRSTSTARTESSVASHNLTTSAIILEGESSTTTSKTTITLDNLTSSSTSSTDTALLFLVTLSDGDVRTLSRHSDAYTTTFGDGEVFTIPSISASTTSERRTSSTRTSTASSTSSTSSSSAERSTITSTVQATGGAGAGEATPTYSSTTSTTSAASSGGGGGGNDTPPAGTIAGGVVGGAAGLAVLVLIAMLFVRWYRRKGQVGHRALPAGSGASPESSAQPTDRSGPGMAERTGLMPFVPAIFRHQNRSAEPSERGFTRVSGRKLPSAFSGGMSSEGARSQPPPEMPLSSSPPEERNLSSTSFYRDSSGFYGGDGAAEAGRSSTSPTSPTSPDSSAPIHSGPEMMTMSPGPQRQPQVHAGGPYTMSPATSDHPTSPPAAAAQFARSDTPSSLRNSRFTEDM